MKTSLRLSLSVLALGLPLLALAAPNSVNGITASLENDGIQVRWEKVDGDIASYRIFYSHTSILNNGGLYDDFESAAGTETNHLLRNVPSTSDVYVSVLAVNAAGEESPYFTEEAHVILSMAPQQSASSAPAMPSSAMQPTSSAPAMPSSVTTPKEDVLRLLNVEAVSATGVVLRFSHPISIDPARATEALEIETASGTTLIMKRFVIQGNNILVDTVEQTRGTAYKVTVGPAVSAAGSAGQRLGISSDQAPVLFSGHPTGLMPSSIPSSSTTSSAATVTNRTEVAQLRLRAQPAGSTYRVEATWQPAGGAVKNYSVAQTTDGGKTFGEARMVKPEERDLIVSGVPAGSFGVHIKTVYSDGTMSKGITQTIQLPKIGVTTPVAGSVTGGGSTALPNSGPALWLAIAMTGAAAGFLETRRKKPAVEVA